jgi:hypothetical protein
MLATIQSRTFCLLICCPKNVKIKIHKSIIFPAVPYGCKTWSLTLREEHRLRTFENRVLRRILGPKRDKVTGGWKKLHDEELHNLYNHNDQVKKYEMVGHVAQMGEKRNAYRILVGKAEGKSYIGR